MATGLIRKVLGAGRPDRGGSPTEPRCSLDIEIDEQEGWLRVYDPRAFRGGRRGFCRRLIAAASEHPGFQKGEVDLVAASCRLKFDPRSTTARSMADAVTAAIREAAAGPIGDGAWWRRDGRWSRLSAFRAPEGLSWWETIDARPGRIRLRHEPATAGAPDLAGLPTSLASLEGIEDSRVSPWSGTLTIDYRPRAPIARRLLDSVEEAMRAASDIDGATVRSRPSVPVATGLRRLRYLALAGGSFALSVVGLIVPGIPTVPFLFATSYYLARSSPALDARLRRAPIFGPVLVEWEQYHGLSVASKAKLMGLTGVIVAVTAILSLASPVAMVVILIVAVIGLYGVARIPGLPDDAPARRFADGRDGLPVLAAPG